MSPKGKLLLLVSFIVLTLSAFSVGYFWSAESEAQRFNDAMTATCATLNQGAPRMISSDTRFDIATLEPHRTICFHYAYLGAVGISQQYLDEHILPLMRATYPDKESYVKYHVRCKYLYFAPDGSVIGSVEVGG